MARRPDDVVGQRLRVLPLSWFHEDEQQLPVLSKLMIAVNASGTLHEIQADLWTAGATAG